MAPRYQAPRLSVGPFMRPTACALLLMACCISIGCAATVRSRLDRLVVGMSTREAVEVLGDGATMLIVETVASEMRDELVRVGIPRRRLDVVMERAALSGARQVVVVRRHYGILGTGRDTVCLLISSDDVLLEHVSWHDN